MRHGLISALALVAALLLHATPTAAQVTNPAPPAATAAAATDLTLTTATIPGTVDPNGAPTTYRVEYGTTTSYGLQTTIRDAGDGADPVTVSVPLTGLTSDTTYHYRLVATNAAGIGRSADRTLRTARPATAQAPAASTGAVQGLTATAVTVTGTVNPRGTATRYRFEYGTGTGLNRRLAYQDAGNATTALPVSAALSLAPNTRYSYRVVATNAGGTARGARRTFTTPRAAALLTMALASNRVVHGAGVAVTGRATSGGAGRVTLALERQLFPFTGPFQQVGSTRRSARDGSYSFTVSPLLISARLRVVARTSPPVTSVARTVRTTPGVGLTIKRRPARRLRFSGLIRPAVRGARASLQRRVRGRFVTLRRVTVRPAGTARSSYRMTLRARRSASVYRVLVVPPRSSGHARGASRVQRVAGLRRR